jgi:DNA-binding SARP family transcriptional activator
MDTSVGRPGDRPDNELATLGALATLLCPDDLMRTVEQALDLLRGATSAEEVALFLRQPDGSSPVLAARSGSRGEAGSELRVPLLGTQEPLGHLIAAWSQPSVCAAGRTLLERASHPLATALRAGFAAHREIAERAVRRAASDADARQTFLRALLRVAGAERATLIVSAERGNPRPDITVTGPTASMCEGSVIAGELACPILDSGRGQVLVGAREAWPERCRRMDGRTTSPCCLPLRDGAHLRGAVILDYGSKAPPEPARDLVPLLEMTQAAQANLASKTAGQNGGLAVLCLGPTEVWRDGRAVPRGAFKRRQAWALLQMLVVADGRPIRREELVRRLWPEASDRGATNRLHGLVHSLRTAIEPSGSAGCWRHVQQSDDGYCLAVDDGRAWLDVRAFREHERRGLHAEHAARLDVAIGHYERALQLYRGDLFAGEPVADWFLLDRTDLRRRCVELAVRLADLWIGAGDPDRAIGCLRHGLRADPLREDLHQMLIHTLADCGRREEARTQYRDCARLLRSELDAEPLPATQRLLRLIG